jgi:hypothetical protein
MKMPLISVPGPVRRWTVMKTLPLLGSVVLASVLVSVAACSSDGSTSSSATDAGTGSETSTPTPPPPGATDAGNDASTTSLGPGPYTIAYAARFAGIDLRPVAAGKATFDGVKLTGYEFNANEQPTAGTNQVNDASGDAFVAIGRWAGGTTGGKFYQAGNAGLMDFPANSGFHYAIGNPADPIPSSGAATYALLAKTPVTVADGSIAPGTFAGTLAANLAGATSKIGFSFTLDVPGDATYTIATTGGAGNVATSEAQVDTTGVKGAFTANVVLTSTGAACSGGAVCTGAIDGFVAGPSAERIAIVAHVFAGSGGAPKTVSAAAVFQKQ